MQKSMRRMHHDDEQLRLKGSKGHSSRLQTSEYPQTTRMEIEASQIIEKKPGHPRGRARRRAKQGPAGLLGGYVTRAWYSVPGPGSDP